jgi:hypothetical protein
LMRTAEAAFGAEDWVTAAAKFEAVLALDPKNSAARARLTEVNEAKGLADSYDQAVRSADAGRWREALEGFERVHRARPYFRNVAARIAEARQHLEPPAKPPAMAPAENPRREPAPVVRSAPSAPVASFQPPVSRPAAVPAALPQKKSRLWIWLLLAAGVFIVLVVVILGIAAALSDEDDAIDWLGQHNAHQVSPGNVTPAPTPVPAAAFTPATGAPSGNAFSSGWWNIRVTGFANEQNRIFFGSNNQFNGTAANNFGSLAVSGIWSYDPVTSTLQMTFAGGNPMIFRLQSDGTGFSSSVGFGALQSHYQFTRDP